MLFLLQSQVEELRTGVAGYRSILLDPAVNLMFQRFKQEIQSMKERLEQSQQELNAWKFTPDRSQWQMNFLVVFF